jgi:transposase
MAPGNRNNPKRAASSDSTYTIRDFMRDYPDDAHCLAYLWQRHYDLGDNRAHCPKCEEIRKFHRVASRPSFSCDSCGHHIHPTAGTVMHKSSTSLQLWFHAIFLMAQTKCGISAKQLERELGVTYKTAWRMFTKIRNELMTQDDAPLSGTVEADEMYVGGKPRQSDRASWAAAASSTERRQAAQKWSRDHKTPVFGMVERGGKSAAHVVPLQPQRAIMGHIEARVERDAMLYTDDARIYDKLTERTGIAHDTINHSARVYVRGDVHTNTIEGVWANMKTGIVGTHHHVSPKWLQGYLNEYVWRYNRRHETHPMFLSLLEQIRPLG